MEESQGRTTAGPSTDSSVGAKTTPAAATNGSRVTSEPLDSREPTSPNREAGSLAEGPIVFGRGPITVEEWILRTQNAAIDRLVPPGPEYIRVIRQAAWQVSSNRVHGPEGTTYRNAKRLAGLRLLLSFDPAVVLAALSTLNQIDATTGRVPRAAKKARKEAAAKKEAGKKREADVAARLKGLVDTRPAKG